MNRPVRIFTSQGTASPIAKASDSFDPGILPPGALLITGSVRGEPGPDGPPDRLQLFYNSLYVVNSDGRIVGTYDKFHLVPFGEYLPFHTWLERIGLHKLAKLQGSFDIGPGPVTLPLPGAPSVSPLICYEIIFPGAVVSAQTMPLRDIYLALARSGKTARTVSA